MSRQAATQINRIVTLVAELTRREAAGEEAATTGELADRFGVPPAQIVEDLVALTRSSDESDGGWLQSLSVALEADRVQVVSRGPYRRPVRFTTAEVAALLIGLAAEAPAAQLSAALTALLPRRVQEAAPLEQRMGAAGAAEGEAHVIALAHDAIDRRRVLTIRYAGSQDPVGSNRRIEPHQVAALDGRHYVVAWCREAGAWRHFRADRVLDAALDGGSFTWRDDFEPLFDPRDVFQAGNEPVAVQVRFAASIARWLAERHPEARRDPDGSLVVTYLAADPSWLMAQVLQYGAEAEIIAPPAFRELMRERVTGSV